MCMWGKRDTSGCTQKALWHCSGQDPIVLLLVIKLHRKPHEDTTGTGIKTFITMIASNPDARYQDDGDVRYSGGYWQEPHSTHMWATWGDPENIQLHEQMRKKTSSRVAQWYLCHSNPHTQQALVHTAHTHQRAYIKHIRLGTCQRQVGRADEANVKSHQPERDLLNDGWAVHRKAWLTQLCAQNTMTATQTAPWRVNCKSSQNFLCFQCFLICQLSKFCLLSALQKAFSFMFIHVCLGTLRSFPKKVKPSWAVKRPVDMRPNKYIVLGVS